MVFKQSLNNRLDILTLLESRVEKNDILLNQIKLLLSGDIKETISQIELGLLKDNSKKGQRKLWEDIKIILLKDNISKEQKEGMIFILARDSNEQKLIRSKIEISGRASK
jgi:hypothetical protein